MKNFLKILLFIIISLIIIFLTIEGLYLPLLILFLGVLILLLLIKDFKWAFVLLVLSLILGQVISFEFNGARILATDFIIGFIFLFWFLQKIVKKEKIKIDFLGVLIILFFFIAFLSLLNSLRFFEISELKTGFFYLIRLFLYLSLYFVFFGISKGKNINYFFNWFLAGVFLVAILGFLQLIFLPDFSFIAKYGFDPHQDRLLSTWFDPNLLSELFILGIVVIIAYFYQIKKSQKKKEILKIIFEKWILIFLFVVFLMALVLTYSRSGYLAFLTTIIFLGIIKSKKFLILSVIAVLILAFSFPFAIERLSKMKKLDETAKMRLESWKNAFQVIQKNPVLGIGYNNLPLIQGIEGQEFHSKSGFDSSFLTIWATTGIFGFLAILAIFISGFWHSFKLFKNKESQFLGIILLGFLISFLVHSQFVNSLLYPHLVVIFWSFLGIINRVDKK